MGGSSGAPVFSDSTGEVIAIHKRQLSPEGEANAVSLASLAPIISSLVPADTASETGPAPFVELDVSGAPDWDTLESGAVTSETKEAAEPAMSDYILQTVEYLMSDKRGLGYDRSDYFVEDLAYGDGIIKATPNTRSMCVAAVTEVIVRSLERWAQDNPGGEQLYAQLPVRRFNRGSLNDLRPWLFQYATPENIPSYDRNFGTGARDALVLFGIGQSVKFEDAKPGDFIYFNRTGGSGHAAVFLGYMKSEYEMTEYFDEDVVGFRYFSSQSSGEAGFDLRAAYFSGHCPSFRREDLLRDCTVIRSRDPRFLSVGRLNEPNRWSTFDAPLHIKALMDGTPLEDIEAIRYETSRSLGSMQLALSAASHLESVVLDPSPAINFDGVTPDSD